jgi:hypothetical protein
MSTTATAPITTTPKIDDFGNGRYSAVMEDVFESCKTLFKCEPAHAAAIARQVGSDLGKYMPPVTGVKFGKLSKDSKVSLKDLTAAVKGVTLTYALHVYRTIRWMDDAFDYGISRNSDFVVTESLAKSLNHFKP